MNSFVIIDVQGFKNIRNNFILKEISILYQNNEYQTFIIKPPYDFCTLYANEQRQIKCMEKHQHGLGWNDGSVTYDSVRKFIQDNISLRTFIYVKGDKKKKWIKEFLGTKHFIINIKDLGCDSLKELKYQYPNQPRCLTHEKMCTLENVFLMKCFLQCDEDEETPWVF